MQPTLSEILDAREQRVQKQKALLKEFQKPLVCFTMNIPGPEKWNRDISIGFFVGCRLLVRAIGEHKLIHFEKNISPCGAEGYFVADMPGSELKKLCISLEDGHITGRLFDMDVLDISGEKIQREALGYEKRACLICHRPAVVCAGRRAHPLEQLTDRVNFLLFVTAQELFAEYIGVEAYLALHREVQATPKPGLVDRNNQGAHKDMDLRHFFVSANTLRPFFVSFAQKGFLTRDLPPKEAFCQLRSIGIEAEKAMLSATNGVNTHKGAIFSLGLLCAAAGRLPPDKWQAETLLSEIAAMTAGIVEGDMQGKTAETAETFGQKLYFSQGIRGVRGQAESGYPAVLQTGLPILGQCLLQGLSENDALCVTLLHLIAATDDTNLIRRGGRQTQIAVQNQLKGLLQKNPMPAMEEISKLDEKFIEKNLSPGGSADLLALTWFLHSLTK